MDLALTLLQTGKDFDERSGLAGVSGSSRYFLCRLLCDEAPAASNTVASYVKRYGVTDRVVSLAIKELVECKAVDKTATQKENGAPGWTLRVASDSGICWRWPLTANQSGRWRSYRYMC